jgi:SAM-dependent methyltransferase
MADDKPRLTYRELMALSEEERYEHSVYHRWDNPANHRKLQRLYGLVAEREDAEIIRAIRGRRVLDVGSGYGFFARRLLDHGFHVTTIDPNQTMIECAKQWYDVEVLPHDAHDLPYRSGSFDTVVFREAVEHLDCERVFEEAERVGAGTIVIFQTHLSPIVQWCRSMAGHDELFPEGLEYFQDLLHRRGYTQQSVSFRDVFALPLSGGTLTPQRVPAVGAIERLVVRLDTLANRLVHMARVQRLFCWRFLLQARKPDGDRITSGATTG